MNGAAAGNGVSTCSGSVIAVTALVLDMVLRGAGELPAMLQRSVACSQEALRGTGRH